MLLVTNIYSKGLYPANKLSNFAAHPFNFDGIFCSSMEAWLQSLKFQDKAKQAEICSLPPKEAKFVGSEKDWNGYLFWNEYAYRRKGYEYRNKADLEARKAKH